MEKHIYRTTVAGNSNVGLYAFANNKFCLVGEEFTNEQVQEIHEVLKVPVHKLSICGTSFIGVFVAGNDNVILVPSIAFDYELDKLRELKINFQVVDTHLTALGNNILCSNSGCIINKEFKPEQKNMITEGLGFNPVSETIDDLNIVGVMGTHTETKGIISRDITPAELKVISDTLKIEFLEGSVNLGTPQIRSGLFCNVNGFVVGLGTTGPEVTNIDEGLGFLDEV